MHCWGRNTYSQLGDGTNTDRNVPVQGLTGAVAVAPGFRHSCALLSGGTVRCWGMNNSGQLGDGSNSDSNVPVQVAGLTSAVGISSGSFMAAHSCAPLADGAVRCWGKNTYGQLGDGSNSDSNVPVGVEPF